MKTLPPDPDNTNHKRAMQANACLHVYRGMSDITSRDDCVADLLTDLMHSLDRSNLDFETELARARVNYLSDITEGTT